MSERGPTTKSLEDRIDEMASEVKEQGRRLDRIDGRLEAMGKPLGILLDPGAMR